jgi:hypothetical protein
MLREVPQFLRKKKTKGLKLEKKTSLRPPFLGELRTFGFISPKTWVTLADVRYQA